MNNPDSHMENRSVRRAKEKVKRKIIIHLIGKEKTDKRTYRNLKAIFTFIGNKEQFTGPQIQKNKGLRGSILYDLLKALQSRGLIERVGEKKSAGRGKTDIYALTIAGKIVSSYVNDDTKLFETTLREISWKEANPLKRFLIESFLENYPSQLMREVLEISVSRAKGLEEGLDINDLLSGVFEEAFFLIPFMREEGKELRFIFRKNAELMEKSEYRDFIFLYFKMQMESNFLYMLEGEKLRKYAESLKENPEHFHIPCDNPECNKVIVLDSFLEMSIPQYCEECKEGVES